MAQIALGQVVGKSAYQSAVDAGFKGTEQEWAESFAHEPERAKGEESRIEALISDEEARAAGEESRIEGLIEAEETRATGEESRIEGLVTAEETRAAGEESRIEGLVAAEEARAEGEESRIEGLVTAEETRAAGEESRIEGLVAAEQTRAEGEESRIEGLVAAEKTRAMLAESVNSVNITSEIARATNAEGNLSQLVTTNKASLVSALNELSSKSDSALKIDGVSITRNTNEELQTRRFVNASNSGGKTLVSNTAANGFVAESNNTPQNAKLSITAGGAATRIAEGGISYSPLSGDGESVAIVAAKNAAGKPKIQLRRNKPAPAAAADIIEDDDLINKAEVQSLIDALQLPEHYKGQIAFAGLKADIEARGADDSSVAPAEGDKALAIDSSELGAFESGAWTWQALTREAGNYYHALMLTSRKDHPGAVTDNGSGWDIAEDVYHSPDEETISLSSEGQLEVADAVMAKVNGAEQADNKSNEIDPEAESEELAAKYPTTGAVIEYVGAAASALEEALAALITVSEDEPQNQSNGGIWLKTGAN